MTKDEILSTLKTAEPQLRAQGVARAALFGSQARGEARHDSDSAGNTYRHDYASVEAASSESRHGDPCGGDPGPRNCPAAPSTFGEEPDRKWGIVHVDLTPTSNFAVGIERHLNSPAAL